MHILLMMAVVMVFNLGVKTVEVTVTKTPVTQTVEPRALDLTITPDDQHSLCGSDGCKPMEVKP